MKDKSLAYKILYYSPRILAIAMALFLASFSFDAFSIKTIAWKKEFTGGMLFIALGLGYTIMVWSQLSILRVLYLSGPLVLIGVLFLICSRINTILSESGQEDGNSQQIK
ncbi:MAG: hypothetical protein NTW49_07485 [Bacteroidia bacterium]|nr:hypothetical protein [Bacteroidia bacterium]